MEQTIAIQTQGSTKKSRKKFLIYPKFQLLLIGFNMTVVTLGFFAVTFGMHHFFKRLAERGADSGLSPSHYYYVFLGSESQSLYGLTLAAYFLSVLLTSVFTLYLSQKIAGPILRMKSYFDGIDGEKNLQPLKFRKGDFFSELPDAINSALDRNARLLK